MKPKQSEAQITEQIAQLTRAVQAEAGRYRDFALYTPTFSVDRSRHRSRRVHLINWTAEAGARAGTLARFTCEDTFHRAVVAAYTAVQEVRRSAQA